MREIDKISISFLIIVKKKFSRYPSKATKKVKLRLSNPFVSLPNRLQIYIIYINVCVKNIVCDLQIATYQIFLQVSQVFCSQSYYSNS